MRGSDNQRPECAEAPTSAMFLYRLPSGRGCSVQDHPAGQAFPCGAGERIGESRLNPFAAQ